MIPNPQGLWPGTYDLMMFPRVWSSLLMVNKQALGTLVSLLMVILERQAKAEGDCFPEPTSSQPLRCWH